MKLHRIELTNFRQFKGTQTIEFCYSSNENVSVIYGENGRGKTGIFRALMFCLYGDRSLSQDELRGNEKKDGLLLINELMLKEQKGHNIETSVAIEFSHKNNIFNIKRSLSGLMKDDDEIVRSQKSIVELQITNENGDTNIPEDDPDKVKAVIQDILNSRLRDYFLFDGERIERLTRNTPERREEVRKGIRTLLDLDATELSIKSLDKLISKIEKEIKHKSSGEAEIIGNKIEELSVEIEGSEIRLEDDRQEIKRLENRINDISDKISQNEETAEQEKKRKELIIQRNDKISEQNQTNRELAYCINLSSQLVASDLIERLHEEIDTYREKGELPPGIRKDFVEKLLEEGICICGNSIDHHHSVERENLISFMKKTFKPGLDKNSEDLFHKLVAISSQNELLSNEFNRLLLKSKRVREEIDDLEIKISTLSEELSEGGSSIDNLIQERNALENEIKNLTKNIGSQEDKIKRDQKEREELRTKFESLTKQKKHLGTLHKKKNLTKEAYHILKKIYNDFAGEIKTKLAKKSTEIFSKLADNETLKDIKTIDIDDNYMLDVLNWADQRRLGEISAGQRQIVSLSFIMSLIKIAGDLEVPLFMDTPFGRLSGKHRDHLIDSIPGMASQWILLATDTEFTAVEADVLRRTNSWGKVYELKKETEGFTKILERKVDEFVPKRKSIV